MGDDHFADVMETYKKCPSAANLKGYAGIVSDNHERRMVLALIDELKDPIATGTIENSGRAMDELVSRLAKVRKPKSEVRPMHISEVLDAYAVQLEERQQNGDDSDTLKTGIAKEFRRWVLDILDREAVHSPIAKQFTDEELCDLAWLWRAGAVMIEAVREVYPLLRVAEHRLTGRYYSIGQEYARTLNKGRLILKRETGHIEDQPWKDDNWSRVLPHLRNEQITH